MSAIVKLDLTIPAPLDLGGSLIRLKPGLNDVDAAAWAQVKDSAVTRGYLAAGELVVVEEPKAEDPKGKGGK